MPSGTAAHDWTINDEWNVRDAWIADATGRRVVDFRAHNLHLVSYSVPVRATMTLAELRPHLHTLPDHPDWIPYRTTYYHRTWGFCLTQRQLDAMGRGAGPYEVVVDTSLEPGELTWGELVIPGDSTDEVLVSAHVCHPSLANDNLSGITVATELAATLAARPRRRWTYRFLFAPGTIGSITWLSQNPDRIASDPARPGAHRSRRAGAAGLQAHPARRPARSTGPRPTWSPAGAARSATTRPTATTSGSTTRWASTWRWAGCRAPRTGSTPSTTPRPTTWPSSRTRSCWRRTTRRWRSSTCWSATAPTST